MTRARWRPGHSDARESSAIASYIPSYPVLVYNTNVAQCDVEADGPFPNDQPYLASTTQISPVSHALIWKPLISRCPILQPAGIAMSARDIRSDEPGPFLTLKPLDNWVVNGCGWNPDPRVCTANWEVEKGEHGNPPLWRSWFDLVAWLIPFPFI